MASTRYLNELDPDALVYRIVPVQWFIGDLRAGKTRLVSPGSWEDPAEDVISWMGFTYREQPSTQVFHHQALPPLFAQCWSMTEESDPLWRAYSQVRYDKASGKQKHPDQEGVQLRSTPRKLLAALEGAAQDVDRCFVGAVRYRAAGDVSQDVVNEVSRAGLLSFREPARRAQIALLKRDAFVHESEVRLIYVGEHGDTSTELVIPFDANKVIDRVVIDGRLLTFEVINRTTELHDAGFAGEIAQDGRYRRTLFDVWLDGSPPDM